ncbi:DUF4097 family beta strand repeat protein [candidate division KSB1 bacterium]|nr:DUF4097 family beta strand repeat protein [candidate division KSB1 bacterium]
MKRLMIAIFTIALICSSLSLANAVTITDTYHKTVDFTNNGDVSVRSTNGKIEVTSWNRSDVEINAEIKVKAGSHRKAEKLLERVEMIVERSGDQLRIDADYPKKSNTGFLDWIFGDNANVTINYTIKVPEETNLNLKSVNGRVMVEDVNGNAELSTVNGGIDAEALKGSVDAHTVNGAVKIKVKSLDRRDNIMLKTTNGSVKLGLPENVSADVEASTVNGSIRTDFPLTIQGKYARHHLDGEINGGGGKIKLSTVNGSINILEY